MTTKITKQACKETERYNPFKEEKNEQNVFEKDLGADQLDKNFKIILYGICVCSPPIYPFIQ